MKNNRLEKISKYFFLIPILFFLALVIVLFFVNNNTKSNNDEWDRGSFNRTFDIYSGSNVSYATVQVVINNAIEKNSLKDKHKVTIIFNDRKVSKVDELESLNTEIVFPKSYSISNK